MDWLVPLADLDYGIEEEQAVLGVLRSKWLTMGAVTQEFEAQFAQLTGSKYAFAVSNATEALHLACLALGLGPGDEVIVPSLTFVATANAVLYTGAEVRFADIFGPHDLTLDPAEIEPLLTPRTKAVIVMHYGGYPCHMDEIMAIANRHSLSVIEDAAHAPGASLNGKLLGAIGDVGCYSFFSNKNLSTGEGGMLVTDRKDIADKVRLQRSHGMTTLTYDRHKGHAHSYDVLDLGYNYRIDELRSALGLAQLKKLPANNARRLAFTHQYREALADIGLELPFTATQGQPAYHLFPILLPQGVDREQFIERLRLQRIQTSIHYPPIHTFSYYQQRFGAISLPRTEQVARREVTLPLYPSMGEDKVALVAAAVQYALA
jgi:dTDP-4-amino-4,6-dideoxygalactose transaminase